MLPFRVDSACGLGGLRLGGEWVGVKFSEELQTSYVRIQSAGEQARRFDRFNTCMTISGSLFRGLRDPNRSPF